MRTTGQISAVKSLDLLLMEAIKVQGIHKTFKDVQAVKGIDLSIQKGEYVAILGPNGAGKTTLMEMIEGIQKPDKGEIAIHGMEWKGNKSKLNSLMGISLQETRFIDKLRVGETLKMFAIFYNLPETRVNVILDLVNLTSKSRAYSVDLSGGQRQRLALGIALLNNPEILLLDEPTTGLDPTARREVWDILYGLKKEGNTTMILTTHYMEEAAYLCDRIVIMDEGEVLARGTLEELLKSHLDGEIIEFSTNPDLSKEMLPNTESLLGSDYNLDSGKWRLVVKDLVNYLPVLQLVIANFDMQLTSLECRKMTLDDLFIQMTGRRLDD